MIEHKPKNAWLGPAEALAVLLACFAVVVVVSGLSLLLLVDPVLNLTFPLPDGPPPETPEAEELLAGLGELELPGMATLDENRRGVTVLRIRGVPSDASVGPTVDDWLFRSGYRSEAYTERKSFDGEAVLLEHARLLIGLQAVVLILFGAIFMWLRVKRTRDRRWDALPRALVVGVAAGVLGFVCSIVIGQIQQLLGWSVEEQEWLVALLEDRKSLIALAPFVAILVPLSEEVFFRGYFFRFLYQRTGTVTAFVLSAACFSVVHLHPPGMIIYFVVGLIFAEACRRTASLTAPVVAHVTYNSAVLAVSLLALQA